MRAMTELPEQAKANTLLASFLEQVEASCCMTIEVNCELIDLFDQVIQ